MWKEYDRRKVANLKNQFGVLPLACGKRLVKQAGLKTYTESLEKTYLNIFKFAIGEKMSNKYVFQA